MAEEPPSVYATSTTQSKLSKSDAILYLERIKLPASTLTQAPSLNLLRQLQLQHVLTVPFESTCLHVLDSLLTGDDLEARIILGNGTPSPLGEAAFDRIVKQRRGGYCFLLNSTFAALLRTLGFRCSEMAAKVSAYLGKDPAITGMQWGATGHECLVVDWVASEGQRFFVDVGFGIGQCPYPIPLHDGATSNSLTPGETYELRLSPHIILSPPSDSHYPDSVPHYTLYRRISSSPSSSFLSPMYTFPLLSTSPRDFVSFNHFNSTHPSATFLLNFVCNILRPDGQRLSLYYKDGMEKAKLKVSASGDFLETEGRKEEQVEFLEMKVGPIRRVLEDRFGFAF